MAATCAQCGAPLKGLGRFLGRRLCSDCERQEHERKREAEVAYRAELEQALVATAPAEELAARLAPLRAALPAPKARELELQTFRSYLDQVLKDDILSAEEEERLAVIMTALGIDQATFQREFAEYAPRLLVARINDGRLPRLPPEKASIIVRKGETVHLEAPATLLKERAIRRSSYAGFSFRIAPGVRFHTGQIRSAPKLEWTVQEVDKGVLSVTSQRVVFRGQRQSLEVPYRKLLGVEFYSDGLRLDVAGRSSAPILRLRQDHLLPIGACINAAAQRHLQG